MPADYYQLLGVPRDADERALKKAYRALAMQYHPDRNPGDTEAETRFKDVSEAYEVLADPEKRQIYDRFGHDGLKGQGFGGFGASSVEDIFGHFGDLFGDLFGGGGGRRSRRGSDMLVELTVDLASCLTPAQHTLEVPRDVRCDGCEGSGAAPGSKPEVCGTCGGVGQVQIARGFIAMHTTCPKCRGQGKTIKSPCSKCRGRGLQRITRSVKVSVPAGMETGMRLRLNGQGEEGPSGAPAGDLYVQVSVREDDRFERHGADLVADLPISMVGACLGEKTTFAALDGAIDLDLPAGTQPDTVVRVAGRGLPRVQSRGRGDLHLRVRVQIPTRTTDQERALLVALRDLQRGGTAVPTEG
ncbi:MAG: molecular chaperone DnaJ [Bradymonadia bacterium]